MIVVGLTGSIGMGKSTTAAMFAEEGIPVHDSDATVHRLYEGPAAAVIEAAFPGTVIGGKVDRAALGRAVIGDEAALKRLEAVVHPMVRDEEKRFLRKAREAGASLAVLDIPLLFETGREKEVDVLVVVTAAPDIQRARVLSRPAMTAEKFEALLARQVPDSVKRARADYLIDTGLGMDAARRRVRAIVATLRARGG